MPNLTVRDGSRDFIHQIDGELASIGRAPTNTIQIDDAKASKEHCRVEREGNRWKVVDLESKNGTLVNGDCRNKAWLEHGDTIQIGKAKIRFGVEGAGRRVEAARPARGGAAPARKAAGAQRRPPPPDDRYDEEEYDDDAPPQRRYGKSSNDKLIVIGAVLLGAIGIFVIVSMVASSLEKDVYNLGLIKEARTMKARDEWREALTYLQKNVDSSGSAYNEVVKEMRLIETGMEDFYKQRDELRARVVLSKLARKIKAYNQGKQSAVPDDILKLVDQLKKKYPATECTRLALANPLMRPWFHNKVPTRASDMMRTPSALLRDWHDAEDRAAEYVKKWQFREARETIEIFLTAREAVLDPDDLERYKAKVEERLRGIGLQADGTYRARQRIAWDHEKKKRWDQAIAVYKEVIEKFGIDLYVRKAQEEINKIEIKRKGGD